MEGAKMERSEEKREKRRTDNGNLSGDSRVGDNCRFMDGSISNGMDRGSGHSSHCTGTVWLARRFAAQLRHRDTQTTIGRGSVDRRLSRWKRTVQAALPRSDKPATMEIMKVTEITPGMIIQLVVALRKRSPRRYIYTYSDRSQIFPRHQYAWR